jgi:CheY-like chemotaxis protein/HPt (histidine-containing phosphotransfer) domain-containing protein
MGGDIHVVSVPGEGSRFTFEMPLLRAAGPADAPQPPAAVAAPTRPLQVLVAEDHPVNRQYMAALLEQMKHPAYFVANGRDAVQAVRARRFDLVLMDLHMPELDGIGAAQAIRALPDRAAATVPIIALTADAFKDTRDRCLLAGMNDFLTKPVNAQDLAAALRRLYGQDAADAPPPGATAPTAAPPPLPSDDAAPLLDSAALAQVRQDLGPQRLAALLADFLRYGPQAVQAMLAAVRDGQPLTLRSEAHAARGAALNLGLAALAQTAQALHEGAAHLPAHEVVHLVQRFESQLGTTRQAAVDAGLLGDMAG